MPGFPPGACELRFGTTRTVALMCLDPRGCCCPAPLNRTSALGLYPVDSHGNRKTQTGALHVASASNSHQRSSAGLQAAERGPAPLKPPRLSRALQGRAKCPPGAEPAARTPVPRRQMRLRLQPQPWHYTGSTQGDVSRDDRPPGAANSPAEACVQLQDRGGGGVGGAVQVPGSPQPGGTGAACVLRPICPSGIFNADIISHLAVQSGRWSISVRSMPDSPYAATRSKDRPPLPDL